VSYPHLIVIELFPFPPQAVEQHMAAAKHAVDLHICVESATALPATDGLFSRTSDPYCVVTFNGMRRKTEPKYRTTSPQWNHVFKFSIIDPSAKLSPPTFYLVDHDILTADDEIGTARMADEALETILAGCAGGGGGCC